MNYCKRRSNCKTPGCNNVATKHRPDGAGFCGRCSGFLMHDTEKKFKIRGKTVYVKKREWKPVPAPPDPSQGKSRNRRDSIRKMLHKQTAFDRIVKGLS